MILATFFIIAGYSTPNPGIMGMEQTGLENGTKGILKITRHPVIWGIALWGISHVLGNGHLAALIFFGGFSVLALTSAHHIDRRRQAKYGDAWRTYKEQTSFWPLGAIIMGRTRVERGEIPWWQTLLSIIAYVCMIWGHAYMGRSVYPKSIF